MTFIIGSKWMKQQKEKEIARRNGAMQTQEIVDKMVLIAKYMYWHVYWQLHVLYIANHVR